MTPIAPLPHMRGDAGTDGRATTAHGARNSLRSLRAICKAYLSLYAKHAMLKLQSMLSKIVRGKEGDAMRTRIRELRRERKMSQAELAEAVGTTRQTITSIEVEKYTASLPLAYKIARYFGLAIEDVFDFSEIDEEL